MKKDIFDKLDIIDQLGYINERLNAGLSLQAVCNCIKIDRKSITRRANKINYKFNKDKNQYKSVMSEVMSEVIYEVISNVVPEVVPEVISKVVTRIGNIEEYQEIKANKETLNKLICMLEGNEKSENSSPTASTQQIVDGKIADAIIMADKKIADAKTIADKKIAVAKIVADKKLADALIIADKKITDAKIKTD